MAIAESILTKAQQARFQHALAVMAKDGSPEEDTPQSLMGKLPHCDCPDCRPDLWQDLPPDIEQMMEDTNI